MNLSELEKLQWAAYEACRAKDMVDVSTRKDEIKMVVPDLAVNPSSTASFERYAPRTVERHMLEVIV